MSKLYKLVFELFVDYAYYFVALCSLENYGVFWIVYSLGGLCNSFILLFEYLLTFMIF